MEVLRGAGVGFPPPTVSRDRAPIGGAKGSERASSVSGGRRGVHSDGSEEAEGLEQIEPQRLGQLEAEAEGEEIQS